MSWLRRGRGDGPATAGLAPSPDDDDGSVALRGALHNINRFINRNSGRLPGVAVVNARRITDTLLEIIRTYDVRTLDVHAMLSVKGTLIDYLPTTLRSYLAVAESARATPSLSGRTPTQSLLEQLASLQTSATAVLAAVRSEDADALMTHGAFLRTKFSGSDLDL